MSLYWHLILQGLIIVIIILYLYVVFPLDTQK